MRNWLFMRKRAGHDRTWTSKKPCGPAAAFVEIRGMGAPGEGSRITRLPIGVVERAMEGTKPVGEARIWAANDAGKGDHEDVGPSGLVRHSREE
jgi:hypothetical protein